MTRQYKTTWTRESTVRTYVAAFWPQPTTSRQRYEQNGPLKHLEQFLGRPAILGDLNDRTLTMFFKWLVGGTLVKKTRLIIQDLLLAIARSAAARDIIPWPMPDWGSRINDRKVIDFAKAGLQRYFEEVYLEDRGAELSHETIKAYRSAIRAYERFSPRGSNIDKVTSRSLKRFRQWLIDRGVAKKTASNRVFVLAAIAKHAHPTRFENSMNRKLRLNGSGTQPLIDVFEAVYLPQRQTITTPGTVHQYRIAIESFGRVLGHIATLDDLTDRNVGAYMRAKRKEGLAIITVNGYRSKLRALWDWCARKGLIDEHPTIEEIPEPMVLPTAWTEPELRQLLIACDEMPGNVCDIPAPLWWKALHLVEWDSGERTGAMLALRWDMLDRKGGQLVVPAEFRKGRRKPMLYTLKRGTLRALDVICEPQRELIFEFDKCLTTFYNRYKRLLKLARLPYVKHKSSLQKMRRSFATHIEAAGGDATEALAHTARSLTVKSYLDPRLIERTPANEVLFSLETAGGAA